jgi:hypothetical protein
MPKGIIVIRWDNKVGTVLEGKYPKELDITEEHVMRVFTTHALGDNKPGFLSMKIEDLNVASYYSGELPKEMGQFCISLILKQDEESEAFEEILAEVASEIISQYGKPGFDDAIAKSYELTSKTIELDENQRYYLIFSDPIRIAILNKLTEGSITRTELTDWIKTTKGQEISDLNVILAPFLKNGLIRFSFVEGINDECIFLIKDVYALRSPELNIVKRARNREYRKDITKVYLDSVAKFFEQYKPSQEDIINLAKLLTDPEIYYATALLKENPIKEEGFLIESRLSEKDLKEVFNKLGENNLLISIKDGGNQNWLFLLSDLKFISFYPEYLIDHKTKME